MSVLKHLNEYNINISEIAPKRPIKEWTLVVLFEKDMISRRTFNPLIRAGYNEYAPLQDIFKGIKQSELLTLRNFGKVCLNELLSALNQLGIVIEE